MRINISRTLRQGAAVLWGNVRLSRTAHQLAIQKQIEELYRVENDINMTTAELYGLDEGEYQDCVKALEILAGQSAQIDEEGEEALSTN